MALGGGFTRGGPGETRQPILDASLSDAYTDDSYWVYRLLFVFINLNCFKNMKFDTAVTK